MNGKPIITMKLQTTLVNPVYYDNEEMYKKYPRAKLPANMDKLPAKFMKGNAGTQLEDLNSTGYRCDELTKDHDGLHVLFGGCSYTWGSGLLVEETWSKKLYNRLNLEEKCSGYFNVAFPGSSVFIQIFDIIRYCETYGNPDVIFYNIPGLNRFFGVEIDQETEKPFDPPMIGNTLISFDSEAIPVVRFMSYQYYYMLEKYCKSNNIKLFSFSWMPDHFFRDLSSQEESPINDFYVYKREDILKYVTEYVLNHKDEKWVKISRDGQHWGTAYNQFWADFIYNKYKEKCV